MYPGKVNVDLSVTRGHTYFDKVTQMRQKDEFGECFVEVTGIL